MQRVCCPRLQSEVSFPSPQVYLLPRHVAQSLAVLFVSCEKLRADLREEEYQQVSPMVLQYWIGTDGAMDSSLLL